MQFITLKYNRGFTLIEVILYVAIASIFIFVLTFFSVSTLEARVKNQTVLEVETAGREAMEIITQRIRNSAKIKKPQRGKTDVILKLQMNNNNLDPTVFSLLNSSVVINEKGGLDIPITNNRVIISNLIFKNVSIKKTFGIMRVNFTVTHINPGNKKEYNYNKTFYGSASLRY